MRALASVVAFLVRNAVAVMVSIAVLGAIGVFLFCGWLMKDTEVDTK